MTDIIQIILCILWGIGSGLIISGGIIAFISVIGLIPIISMRTNTTRHSLLYGGAISLGAVLGSVFSIWDLYIPVPKIVIIAMAFAFGVFTGGLIVALAEVLDVIPIMDRRMKMKKGISLFIYSLAAGKMVGALYYWFYPGILKMVLSH